VDRFLGEKGIPKDNAAGREQLSKLTEGRRAEEHKEDFEQIRCDPERILADYDVSPETVGQAVATLEDVQ
jgi:hypothetical protein